ncbi:DUF2380 domain-containing protein, partial [Candidatus Parcubacteria bacterium]
DGAGIAYDIYVIRTEGASFGNVATFLVDVVLAAAPFIPSIGGLKALGKAASHGDEVVKLGKAASHGDEIVKARLLTAKANASTKTVKHHIFNKFRGKSPVSQKYRNFFKQHGIEVDKWTVEIPEALHKDWIHKAGQNWTTRWKRWIDANPNATTREVYQFAGQLMDEFGINHLPLVPYR